jgi:hypothetical protein
VHNTQELLIGEFRQEWLKTTEPRIVIPTLQQPARDSR